MKLLRGTNKPPCAHLKMISQPPKLPHDPPFSIRPTIKLQKNKHDCHEAPTG